MISTQTPPELSASKRDGDGRLVGLIYDSATPLPAPDANPWLVAVDSSDNALRAVAHAASQAGALTACALHLIHVQPWLSIEAAELELANRGLGATARARATLDAAGLSWRLHVVLGDPAESIISSAIRLRPTVLVIGSRGLNAAESLLVGSVAYKVIHLSPVPVVVVP
jgi:nucleotide-binding universal stress UspA family protein